jgi:hypothetical protein
VGISNSAFKDLAGGKPICLSATQTAQLQTALKKA